ncbi:hypothetical protein C2E23DRAFT_774032 [Lenzites betulinus]|nr:hypothetical protein C2E23DRAFT_774032 [Lenzites betulinus]
MSIATRSNYGTGTSRCCRSDKVRVKAVKKGGENKMEECILRYPSTVDDFIKTLVPCTTPFPFSQTIKNAFSDYKPGHWGAYHSSPHLLPCLEKLVAPFEADKQVSFIHTKDTRIDFPFDAFKDAHHKTAPHIAVSFPGEGVPSHTWQHFASIIEVKPQEEDDPFLFLDKERVPSALQITTNARNLLLAHGFLAAFVVGIYGKTARIARFDHSGAVVSPCIHLSSDEGATALRRFFWHFTHPAVGKTVAGSDPTVARLSAEDQAWIKMQLQNANAKNWEQHVGELAKGRRIEVYEQSTGLYVPYLLYHLISVNADLFSRNTMVWRAIEDTRMWKGGVLVCDPARASESVKPQIVKEAWRQLVNRAETDVYRRLQAKSVRRGVATMECGGDIGELEMRWWQETADRRLKGPFSKPAEASASPTALTPAAPSRHPVYAPFSSIGSGRPPTAGGDTSGTDQQPLDFPLPLPQHQTYSWRLFGPQFWVYERSHVRMVIDEVGRPLTEFTSTYELVAALRAAVIGHKHAWEKAQVLHGDVSVGNILIADEPASDWDPVGFLHDFDYSSMPECDREPSEEEACNGSSESDSGAEDDTDKLSITGTFYFMAIELLLNAPGTIHERHHDLESFYWVLIWVIVRHTECKQELYAGPRIHKGLFVWKSDKAAAQQKRNFLRLDAVVVKNNPPLTKLVAELTALVWRNQRDILDSSKGPECKLTHDAFLKALNAALAPDQVWPTNDWQRYTKPGEGKPRSDPPVICLPQGFRALVPHAHFSEVDPPPETDSGAHPSVRSGPNPPKGDMDSPEVASTHRAGRPLKRSAEDVSSPPPTKRQKMAADARRVGGNYSAEASQVNHAGAGASQAFRKSRSARRPRLRVPNPLPTHASARLQEEPELVFI